MAVTIPLRCTCGALRGEVRGVTARNARRLSCCCDDCQRYARVLGRQGELLDDHGGTDLSYATPCRVSLSHGLEHLRCLQLREGGLLRWYAGCCRTPVAHTVASPKTAFVGMPHLFMDHRRAPLTRDEALGPLVRHFQARFAQGPVPPGAHLGTPLSSLVAGHARILWDSLCGRGRPSPFFDAASGQPVVKPDLLGPTAGRA